jgi:hypothetical protein
MKSTISFEGKSYTERDNKNPLMSNKSCACGNPMHIPQGAWELGIVTSCSHCDIKKEDYVFPFKNHCNYITQSYLELIEEGGDISLD